MAKSTYQYTGNTEIDNLTYVILEARCNVCKKTKRILADPIGFHKWINGTLIQQALPDLRSADRELLISGTCGDCFDKITEEDAN